MLQLTNKQLAPVITWLIGLGVTATIMRKGVTAIEKKRIEDILKIAGKDDTAVKLIDDMFKAVMGYMEVGFTMETTLALQRNRLEGEELRSLKQRLDGNRRMAHNRLLDSIKIANRYLFRTFGSEMPAGGVYSGDMDHLINMDQYRAAFGDWAGRLIMAFYDTKTR
jgi:hypothetical protein